MSRRSAKAAFISATGSCGPVSAAMAACCAGVDVQAVVDSRIFVASSTTEATKIRESTTACTSTPAQHAAIAALTGPQEPVAEMQAAFARRRDAVADRLAAMDGVAAPRPEGAFYAFLDPEGYDDSMALAKRLVREAGVVLAPGSGFGDAGAGKLRLSFANSMDRLEEGLDRLEAAL